MADIPCGICQSNLGEPGEDASASIVVVVDVGGCHTDAQVISVQVL
jgi:hypothetical protein